MGCKGSKLDDQEAVALCRARADLLAAAVRHRYALANAHADSIESVAQGRWWRACEPAAALLRPIVVGAGIRAGVAGRLASAPRP